MPCLMVSGGNVILYVMTFSWLQESLPVVPPGCSTEKPDTIQDFIEKGKAALVSVGIIRDGIVKESVVGELLSMFVT